MNMSDEEKKKWGRMSVRQSAQCMMKRDIIMKDMMMIL